MLDRDLLHLGEDVEIDPQNFFPSPEYSDTRDFMTKLWSTVMGRVCSTNERDKCIKVIVVWDVTPYRLV
jgi:hypothetical protein